MYEELQTVIAKYTKIVEEGPTGKGFTRTGGKGRRRVPRRLIEHLCNNTENLFNFLKDSKLILSSVKCGKCGNDLTFKNKNGTTDGVIWACGKTLSPGQRCNGSKSIRYSSWFTGSHLSIEKILLITYDILYKCPAIYISDTYDVNPQTVNDWTSFIRETLVECVVDHSESIGGPGVTVEINESQLGKRRLNRRHFEEGQWVLGGIDRSEGKMFLVVVEDKTTKTLTELIKQWVLPESVVYTDSWKPYDRLGSEGYIQLTENHLLSFVDPQTHTGSIEGKWREEKHFIPTYSKVKGCFPNYLGHFMFSKLVKQEGDDVFLHFLNIIRQVDWSERAPKPSKCTND